MRLVDRILRAVEEGRLPPITPSTKKGKVTHFHFVGVTTAIEMVVSEYEVLVIASAPDKAGCDILIELQAEPVFRESGVGCSICDRVDRSVNFTSVAELTEDHILKPLQTWCAETLKEADFLHFTVQAGLLWAELLTASELPKNPGLLVPVRAG